MLRITWQLLFVVSLLPLWVDWLTLPFGISTSINRQLWLPVLWFLIFQALTLKQIWRKTQNKFQNEFFIKLLKSLNIIFLDILIVGISFFAVLLIFEPPYQLTNYSICKNISYTISEEFDFKPSEIKSVFVSTIPWLYYQELIPNKSLDKYWFNDDNEFILTREDFIVSSDFENFRDCFGYKRKNMLVCNNMIYFNPKLLLYSNKEEAKSAFIYSETADLEWKSQREMLLKDCGEEKIIEYLYEPPIPKFKIYAE